MILADGYCQRSVVWEDLPIGASQWTVADGRAAGDIWQMSGVLRGTQFGYF